MKSGKLSVEMEYCHGRLRMRVFFMAQNRYDLIIPALGNRQGQFQSASDQNGNT
jgi:hypothetical protein